MPETDAIVFEDKKVTYTELNKTSKSISKVSNKQGFKNGSTCCITYGKIN